MSEQGRSRYTIGVAAQLAGLHEQSLRMYERRGLVQPRRSKGNIRLYSDDDIDQIRFIRRLVDDLGVNLAGVEVIIQMRRQLLQAQASLVELEERLQAEHR